MFYIIKIMKFHSLLFLALFIVNLKTGRGAEDVVEYYNFDQQYAIFSQKVTWDEASILCESYNGRLAILDDVDKSAAVAKAMADSNIVMEDVWIGGRKTNSEWIWYHGRNSSEKSALPSEPIVDDYPPWFQEPNRDMKDCLAIDRRSHQHPNFVDLDCRLLRPYICEILVPEGPISNPIPSKWVRIQRSTYILYHARLGWVDAAIYCRSQGKRLAILKDPNAINILTNNMIRSRPTLESAWIGARYDFGSWKWLSTGSLLSPISDDSNYPPWRFGRPEGEGCVLLDRHMEDAPNFLETPCDRKRDFVCEEYSPGEDDDWINDPTKFNHDNRTYIIYPYAKSWDQSRTYCEERGSILAYLQDMNITNLMVRAMGDHPKEISHVWLGGLYNENRSDWQWVHNDKPIPTSQDATGFPPWAPIDDDNSQYRESLCLNLDRTDHAKPHVYGLACFNTQAFVCEITCDIPPVVKNGTWNCLDTDSGKSCTLKCDPGFYVLGVNTANCSSADGWHNVKSWLEAPLCLSSKDYFTRMVRSLSREMQKSSGYYVILSHFTQDYQSSLLGLTEKLISFFPPSKHLKLGLTSYVTDPKTSLTYNQREACVALNSLSEMKSKLTTTNKNVNDTEWYDNLMKNSAQRTLIVAVLDAESGAKNRDYFVKLKNAGHHVAILGSINDAVDLTTIPTIGYDRRLNLYLFDKDEMVEIIAEFGKTKKKYPSCSKDVLKDKADKPSNTEASKTEKEDPKEVAKEADQKEPESAAAASVEEPPT